MKTWRVRKQEEALFTEWGDRAEWGTLYFSGPSVGPINGLRWVRR
jgi:hypothetical protein